MNRYQEPIPNIKDAIEYAFGNNPNYYHAYSAIQFSPDELGSLYEIKKHITPGSTVLTANIAGEHGLFPKLYGAEHVLTFDISYNSYLLTCLKIGALQAFRNHLDYERFVRSLINYTISGTLSSIPKLDKILPYLTDIQKDYIKETDRLKIPTLVDNVKIPFYSIQQPDYDKLRDLVKSPFPFIWTDITELDKKLGDDKFDFINYSNLSGLLPTDKAEQILKDTKKHLNLNGEIFLTEERNTDSIKSMIEDIYKKPDWNITFLKAKYGMGFDQFIIQRTQSRSY